MTTNTLNPAEISQPLKVEKSDFRAAWRERQEHSSYEMAIYILAQAVEFGESEKRRESDETAVEWAARRLKKSFTPISNKKKLYSGRRPYDTLERDLFTFFMNPTFAIVGDSYDETMLSKCKALAQSAHMAVRASRK